MAAAVVVGGENKVIIKNVNELINQPIHCSTPDHELVVYPRWIIFYSECGYKKPCYAKFFIENRNKFAVVYAIKARQKLFRLGCNSNGLLMPGEKQTIKLFLLPCDEWPLGINDYVSKQMKIVLESLRIPDNVRPDNQLDTVSISKYIWKKSVTDWPLERLYSKISIALEKCDPPGGSVGGAAPPTSSTATDGTSAK